jgi:hypothetical protein
MSINRLRLNIYSFREKECIFPSPEGANYPRRVGFVFRPFRAREGWSSFLPWASPMAVIYRPFRAIELMV